MDLLNETVLLKTKSTLFNLLIREISQFLCFERLLNMAYVAYKKSIFPRNAILVAVSYQALFRLSLYKIPAVYLSGAKMCVFARYATLVPRLVLLYYRTVKRLLIAILQIRVRNGKLVLLFLNQNICSGDLNGPIK